LVAIGVNERGYREILGICKGAKENKTGWSAFLKQLKERGLKGVRLITSDACIGLAESAAEFFLKVPGKGASCTFSATCLDQGAEIAVMLKAIQPARTSRQHARRPTDEAAGRRRGCAPARCSVDHPRPVDTDACPKRLRQASIELPSCLGPTLSSARQHFLTLSNPLLCLTTANTRAKK
jgi:hypothetical protein